MLERPDRFGSNGGIVIEAHLLQFSVDMLAIYVTMSNVTIGHL